MRRPCIEPGCNQLAPEGTARCTPHNLEQGHTKNGRRRARAHPSQGAAAQTRRDLNQHGSGYCARCNQPFAAGHLEVDHTTPLADGGHDTFDNIQLLCTPCHTTKSATEQRQRHRT